MQEYLYNLPMVRKDSTNVTKGVTLITSFSAGQETYCRLTWEFDTSFLDNSNPSSKIRRGSGWNWAESPLDDFQLNILNCSNLRIVNQITAMNTLL